MKIDTYKKAEAIQHKIRRLEVIQDSIQKNGLPVEGHDSELGTFELDEDVREKITSSALAILKIELRELHNQFIML